MYAGDFAKAPAPGRWVEHLQPIGSPRLAPARVNGPHVWHVSLGTLPRWPKPIDRQRDRIPLYGKGSGALIDDLGRPWASEAEIARRLRADKWESRWLLKFELPPEHFRPWVAMDLATDVTLPEEVKTLLRDLGRSGAPDVIAWRMELDGLRIVGVESKRVGRNRDRVGTKQSAWYWRALTSGRIRHEDLVIAEWTNDPAPLG